MIVYGTSLLYAVHSAPNGNFVHTLYGSVLLPDRVRHTTATGPLYILEVPVVPRTLGVRMRDDEWHFATLCRPLCSKRQFRTHTLYGSVLFPDRLCHTNAKGCLHILGGPIVPCTLDEPIRDGVWHFTTPCGPLCCKLHFRTPSVRICTAP